MAYNLLYYRASNPPCSHSQPPLTRGAELKTIVKHVNPDILAVNELGSTPTNADNILNTVLNTDGENRYTQANYSNNNFSNLVNMLFYDSTQVALYSQSKVDKDLNNQDLVRVIDLYRLYYKDPKLSLGADTIFFTVVVAHLKAGNDVQDRFDREKAANALMDHLENNVADDNVILCGDLNIYGNAQMAYQVLTNYSTASERFFDPLGQAGSWNNNSNYANIHTQSTRSSSSGCHVGGGMDDRFDFFLVSNEVLIGSDKVKFVPSSYYAVGQDGMHFNQSINSGTNNAVPQNVLSALFNFSDHLPIRMQIEVEQSNIGISEDELLQSSIRFTNPFEGNLTLRLSQSLKRDLQYEILDITGKSMNTGFIEANASEKIIKSVNWPSGIYFLVVKDSSGLSMSRKIIKS